MFSIILFAGGFAIGLPNHDRRIEPPPAPPPCIGGVGPDCDASSRWRSSEPRPPARECPDGSSEATVRPGVRYCIPDRPIKE